MTTLSHLLVLAQDATLPSADSIAATGDWLFKKSPYLFGLSVLSGLFYLMLRYARREWQTQTLELARATQELKLQADAVGHSHEMERLAAQGRITALEADKEASKALVAERVKETVNELNASRSASDAAVVESNKLVSNVHHLLDRMHKEHAD